MNDPTYDRKQIDANPVWKKAFQLSEMENDSAPIGWAQYIPRAKKLLKSMGLKNCVNCEYLDYYEGNIYDGEGPNGHFCTGREYKSSREESKHLEKLESDSYIERPKKCHKPRGASDE